MTLAMYETNPKPGTLFANRFFIMHEAGRGGMGSVFRAMDKLSGELVALKVAHEISPISESRGQRFLREAEVLAKLEHPGIVAHVAHGNTVEGQFYLAMQWLEGENLATKLEEGPLSMVDSLTLITRVAEALARAHAQGIVHRDIKPSNLLLRNSRVDLATILDFGIARDNSRLSVTTTGTAIGTADYVAPEQLRSASEIDAAADIFSLGCVFYECLTGKPPFHAGSLAAVLARILLEEPVAVSRERPEVPKEWEALLARMLHKEPAQRPRNAQALLAELSLLAPAPTETHGATLTKALAPPKSISMTGWRSGERTLISVVLGTAAPTNTNDPAPGANPKLRDNSTVRHLLRQVGARYVELADGSFLATVILRGSAKDQASAAVRAALALHENTPESRVAVVTGPAAMQEGMAIGAAVDEAVKLLEQMRAPQFPKNALRGVALCPVTAGLIDQQFEVVRFEGGAFVHHERIKPDAQRLLLGKPTPCIGREQELARLDKVYQQCIDEPSAQAVLVTAPAGVGKSRLRHEFSMRQKEKTPHTKVLMAFGDPLVAGSPYGLLRGALFDVAGIPRGAPTHVIHSLLRDNLCRSVDPNDLERVFDFLGELCQMHFPDERRPSLQAARQNPKLMSEQIELAFLDWLRTECTRQPVILILEDMHWGDRLTKHLVDSAMRNLRDLPLFVLALARPEIHDVFPGLHASHFHELSLRPLSKKVAERLAREILGDQFADQEVVQKLVQRSGGNALFLEELIRATAEGKGDDVPETVLATLQARLSRLPTEPRRMLLAASIFGESFWTGAIHALYGTAHIERGIMQLVAAELIEKHRNSRLPGEAEFGFRHALVRDAAYGLLSEDDRAAGHQIARRWLEAKGERDPMALAEHARLAGETSIAMDLYGRAATQSLERNDMAETSSRARLGIECGPKGETLGFFRALQAIASFGLADFDQCFAMGDEALALLPRGSLWWCRAAEAIALNITSTPARLPAFLQTILDVTPAPEAASAYTRVAATLYRLVGTVNMRQTWPIWDQKLDELAKLVPENDIVTLGVITMERFIRVLQTEPDPWLAITLGERCKIVFEQASYLQRLGLTVTLLGGCYFHIAAWEDADVYIRNGLAIANQARDGLSKIMAYAWRTLMLVERGGSESWGEAERIISELRATNAGAFSEAYASAVLAWLCLARGEYARCEAEVRACFKVFKAVPAEELRMLPVLLDALRLQGRSAEAAAEAKYGLTLLDSVGCAGPADVPLHVAAAEALHANGEIADAHAALEKALAGMRERASKLPEGNRRTQYLCGRRENVRATELAHAWLSIPSDDLMR